MNHLSDKPPGTTAWRQGCRCVQCRTIQNAAYMDYYNRNREKQKAWLRRNYAKNREQNHRRDAERYRADPEKKKLSAKRWREANRERKAAMNAEWYRANKLRVKANVKRWQAKNAASVCLMRQRRRARVMGAQGSHTCEQWQAILELFEHRCALCGSPERLTKDHIIPLSKNGSDYATNLQPLCRSCNSRKKDKLPANRESKYRPAQ